MNAQQAQTIFSQMGGMSRIKAMTGAKHFAFDSEAGYASFKFSGCKTANYIKITLNDLDLYDLEFGKVKKFDYTVVETINNVYNEDLKRIFESTTGLDLSL